MSNAHGFTYTLTFHISRIRPNFVLPMYSECGQELMLIADTIAHELTV